MKKVLTISAAVAIATSVFAQGNINWQGTTRGVWDDNANGTAVAVLGSHAENVDVALMVSVATTNTAALPSIDSLSATGLGSYTINGLTGDYVQTNALTSGTSFNNAAAWSAILGDANYQAVVGTNGNAVIQAQSNNGSFVYNNSSSFNFNGVNGGLTYYFYEIAWAGNYATAALAQAAGAAVGWSAVFAYTPTSGATPATSTSGSPTPFGAFGPVTPTPEPTTVALAGLGGLALLGLRRRK